MKSSISTEWFPADSKLSSGLMFSALISCTTLLLQSFSFLSSCNFPFPPFRPNLANFNSSVHLFSYFKIISGRYSHALFHVSHLFSFSSAPHKSCTLLYPLSSFLAIPPFNLASQQHAARNLLVQNFISSALVHNFSRFYSHF